MNKQSEHSNRYNKKNTKTILVRLNLKTDIDIIDRLNNLDAGETKTGYIKRLIRKDITKSDN